MNSTQHSGKIPLNEGQPAIETCELSRSFGGTKAVGNLNLQVPTGSFFGFLGPNGAGKSTTIAMLTGLLTPSSGTARVLGHDLLKQPVLIKSQIGVVPEQLALFERLSGWEHLQLVGRLYGLSREDTRQRADHLLEFMELQNEAGRLIVEYSRGMKKKLALAAALIHRPRLLFLDEPFEGIDAISARSIREMLLRLVHSGMTIFLTSHVLETVEKLCSHVAIIHQGKLLTAGSMPGLVQSLQGEEGESPTLEDLFVHLLGRPRSESHRLGWLLGETHSSADKQPPGPDESG